MVTRLIIILSVLFAIGFVDARTQGLRDSRGRDFWLAVPPNDHRQGSDSSSFLSLLFNCDQRTDVRIEARARDGSVDIRTFTVPGAAMWETRYSTIQYEHRGVTAPDGSTADCEKAMPMSIHVTTTTDVTVYAVLRDVNTSDAWMSLPTDALGTSYRVSTYPSTAVADTTSFIGIPIYTFTAVYPSQFVVVATEDNTDVTIDLSVSRSSVSNGTRRTVRLNKGQSYLVQARVTETRQNDDLTGTRVTGSKPLVMLSSHYRAQVPILVEEASRDCLVEQLPSTDTWGKHIIVPPLRRPNDFQSAGPSDVTVCRIVADVDSTLVQVNGSLPWQIDAGKFWDLPLTTALDIVSTKPVLVTIIDRSANRSTGGVRRSGDPSLILMPPVEQFLNAYRVANAEPQAVGAPVFRQHQITCVVPISAVASLTIDGAPSPAPTAIPGTSYAYVHMNVAAGQHEVLCDSAFGIVVYGYGPAESYGYTGGMAFDRLYIPSVVLRVLDIQGAPGDADTIHAVVDSISDRIDLFLSGAIRLDGAMMLDLSTFVPRTSTVEDPATMLGSIPFSLNFDTLSVGDTISIVPGWHTLGRDTVTVSTLANILWTTGSGDTVDVVTTIIDGRVITSDVCLDQQPRLFDPLPAVTTRERRYYDVRGRFVGTTLDGLPPGVYFHR
ncbi:MAG: IgGFc-binding protein [Ignavibacteria bacterium]|nr:IgGFc-binding protein [Ignavibacteria bacterium]